MEHGYLNKLRAAVLGANDGIISVATTLVALVGVMSQQGLVLTAVAITLAGAISMSAGEYVSVAAQRDSEINHNETHLTSPLAAAGASFIAFLAGAVVPAITAVLTQNIIAIVGAVLVSLLVTSLLASDKNTSKKKGMIRMIAVGSVSLLLGVVINHALNSFLVTA